MGMVFYPPLIVSPCDILLFLLTFGVSYLNVILGITQASMLTMLYVQLKHLFDVSSDLCKIELDVSELERKKLAQLHRREKFIRILLVLLVIIDISSFAIMSWLLVSKAQQKHDCDNLMQLLNDQDIKALYKIHTGIRSGLALSTSVWLITISCLINNLINLGTTDNL